MTGSRADASSAVASGASARTTAGDAGPRVVVVGGGIAGITAALHARRGGARVTLVTKRELDDTATALAQGGIAGVVFDDDRTDDHAHDTIVAGAGLCDPAAVRVLVSEAATRIAELVDAGVHFDREPDGSYVKGLEAAHSYPRILHAGGDATGLAIQRALAGRLRGSGVEVLEHAFLVDLVVAEAPVAPETTAGMAAERARPIGPCIRGVDLLLADGSRRTVAADAVVLATGGAGHLFAHTTNPEVATGDGVAAALRAGAQADDLEFVQFHPTVLTDGEPFLVSEAVRGEGATLVDEQGRRFVFDDHPDGELAPRDVVARAIARRMAEQGGRPVRLDATGLGATPEGCAAFLARRFPSIDRAVRERGLDWAREPIPVTPAAHYVMGGVSTDLDGRTSLPGLFAVGEVARTGVHGANRLASNSLLEGAVFGARAGAAACDSAVTASLWPAFAPVDGPSAPAAGLSATVDVEPFSRAALQQVMWEHAGLVRDAAGLERAIARIDGWRGQRARATGVDAAKTSVRAHEDDNLLLVAAHVVRAALRRRGSAGAHFRSDAVAARGVPALASATTATPLHVSSAPAA